jgi:hypothetical protein
MYCDDVKFLRNVAGLSSFSVAFGCNTDPVNRVLSIVGLMCLLDTVIGDIPDGDVYDMTI